MTCIQSQTSLPVLGECVGALTDAWAYTGCMIIILYYYLCGTVCEYVCAYVYVPTCMRTYRYVCTGSCAYPCAYVSARV